MLSKKGIESMSYTDFIGLINQWNVLPGSFVTLSQRINYSKINNNSNILEIACTTGFSIREVSNITGCCGVGIDISKKSIEAAILNQYRYGLRDHVEYSVVDAYEYQTDHQFSHIIIGAGLKFFLDQEKIIEKIVELLENGGYLLASPFYVIEKIPDELVEEAKGIFGIIITNEYYKEVMNYYNKFEILYEEKRNLVKETKEEIEYYVKCTIDRFVENNHIFLSKEVYNAIYIRLMKIKLMSNKLRPYQAYTTLVLRYRKDIYPNRFVELF